jgi:transcriptional regulator with XRE-family HTH domain
VWYIKVSAIMTGGDNMVKLREARLKKFLSIRALAAQAGVSTRTIGEAEAGRRTPYFGSARKIAAALELEPGEIEEFAVRADEGFQEKDAA